MFFRRTRLPRLFAPVRQYLTQVDLQEHQEKILLLLALVISALIGLIIVAFLYVTEQLSKFLVNANALQRLLGPFIGSLIAGVLIYRFFPEARGSGIPQTRVALLLQNGVIHFRAVLGKFLCCSISLGSGVALGREGPSVHIGAGLASWAGRKLGLDAEHVRSLIPVGAAAAVAAAFNTPLAAVLFTLEEILADLNARLVGAVVIGAATSWMVLRLLLGDEPLFHVPAYQLVHPVEFLIYALLGLLGGLVSTVFVKLLLAQRSVFLRVPGAWRAFTPALGGLTVGLLALVVPGVIGVGYNLVNDALNGRLALTLLLTLLGLKLIATSVSYSAGNAGGIFGPSLFIGAMLGGGVGSLAHSALPDLTGNAGAYALVGMGAAFAGIIRTPMTSVIMIFELTRDYTIIVPLMIANLCSYFVAQRFQRTPIYEALSRQDGIAMPSAHHLPAPLTIAEALERASDPIDGASHSGLHLYPDDPLDTALQQMGRDKVDRLPVFSRVGGQQIGSITLSGAINAYRKQPTVSEARLVSATNWLPRLAAIAVAAVIILAGLVFWQRTRRSSVALSALTQGREFAAQGHWDSAVAAYRVALAATPGDNQVRAGLGLALERTGNLTEATTYLTEALKSNPKDPSVLLGLAEVARAQHRDDQALALYRQAISLDWPAKEEARLREAQLAFAALLANSGKRAEATAVLQTVIDQTGDDPVVAKRAAESIRRTSAPTQAEEAYKVLIRRFPADTEVWRRLGEVQEEVGKFEPARNSYRQALRLDANDAEASRSTARLDDILTLDPTLRRLPAQTRAARWHQVLQRVLTSATPCLTPQQLDPAGKLLRTPPSNLASSDKKMSAALELWRDLPQTCKNDPALSRVMTKAGE